MSSYKTRKIEFRETIEVNDWKIKIYTISKIGNFDHPVFYQFVQKEIASWLTMENSFNADHDQIGFLILHAGTEGIFSLMNWWVDQYMLNTHIFLSNPNKPNQFKKISGDGLAPCIWELEVINHERLSWMKNVLQKEEPDYPTYINDVFNCEI